LSLIENSLERLRRTAHASRESRATAVALPVIARAEPNAAPEPRPVHRKISIDTARLRAEGYLPDAAHERRFADYCHRIKRPLIDRALAAGGADDQRVALISSALPGDGKTFITLNLAFSMARERDISVLLIDGDLPRARVSRAFGLQNEPGLLAALRDDGLDAESLVLDTDVPRLQVLAAGGPVDDVAELIASTRMQEIMARLLSQDGRRLVLLDSPPLLVSSEARALARIPGQIVLVARADRTPRQALLDAIAHVDRKKLLGLVLNDAPGASEGGYYDYYGQAERG
jgi:protein-tyrosine kinase